MNFKKSLVTNFICLKKALHSLLLCDFTIDNRSIVSNLSNHGRIFLFKSLLTFFIHIRFIYRKLTVQKKDHIDKY